VLSDHKERKEDKVLLVLKELLGLQVIQDLLVLRELLEVKEQ
jgi:hypothetical protein